LPYRTPLDEGGTFIPNGDPNPPAWEIWRNNAWFQYSWISNELNSPKVLVCPSDRVSGVARVVADNWSGSNPHGGYATPGFRNAATSYTIGLDCTVVGTDKVKREPILSYEESPEHILSTDHNLTHDVNSSRCSSGITAAVQIGILPAKAGWDPGTHFPNGQVLMLDGRVVAVNNSGLNQLLDNGSVEGGGDGDADDVNIVHFLFP
jgi:hypothetical protein